MNNLMLKNGVSVVIREARTSDANKILEYVNTISSESDFLTFGQGEFGVSILKEYWGNGIGTELIKYLIEWSKQSGLIRKINLIVRDDNFSAIHVYKKLGFTQEGIISRNLQINGKFYDALFMGYTVD
jgi:RimJ/RimL family protein N-acetyltransferase